MTKMRIAIPVALISVSGSEANANAKAACPVLSWRTTAQCWTTRKCSVFLSFVLAFVAVTTFRSAAQTVLEPGIAQPLKSDPTQMIRQARQFITSISPSSGIVGASVTISGSNFGSAQGSSTVTFNGTVAPVTKWTNSSIVANVPFGHSSENVVVTVGGTASNGINFTVLTRSASPIAANYFGMQCGPGFLPTANNCPNETGTHTPAWPASVAQPGLLRLWDSQVSWSYLMTSYGAGVGTYDWQQLDGYLDDIAAHQPITVNYVFGCVPSFATSGPSGTTPGSCGNNGSATPPDDLGMGHGGSSPTFNQFVTDLLHHCSPAGNCVKTLITGYELWNEANVSTGPGVRWTGTQLQLYRMVAPAVAIIKANVSNAKIFTPSITGGGGPWLAGWLSTELSNGPISNVYNIHKYLNDKLPEDVISGISSDLAPNTVSALPWVMGETGYDNIRLPYSCNTALYTTADCIGQMVRWNLLLFSNGASGLYWYYWNTYIGSDPRYATAYHSMMQYLLGGKFGGPCTSTVVGAATTWTCNFTESGAQTALWVWTPSETGSSFTVPSGYVDYRDLTGTKTTVSGGRSITIGPMPIMLEQ